jgi:hypothetical protein
MLGGFAIWLDSARGSFGNFPRSRHIAFSSNNHRYIFGWYRSAADYFHPLKLTLTVAEHAPEAGLLEPEGEAPSVAQDICRDAHVLEEPAYGVLRLQAQEVSDRQSRR